MTKIIIRIDDIIPELNWNIFNQIIKKLNEYNIQPIIGVIPNNKDNYIKYDKNIITEENFWIKIKNFSREGYIIAQHGFEHTDITGKSGLLGFNNRSELVGLSYKLQYDRIKKGKEILENKLGIKIKWFMAPDHSFDKTTCKVLKKLGFEYITDGIALNPFEKYNLKWLPQQLWSLKKDIYGFNGISTICLHINEYDDSFIVEFNSFIDRNHKNILSKNDIEKLNFENNTFKMVINVLFQLYFKLLFNLFKLYKKIKG